MVNGVKVSTNVADVGVGVGAGVSGYAPDGWLELLKRAIKNGKSGPSVGMDAELAAQGGNFLVRLAQ